MTERLSFFAIDRVSAIVGILVFGAFYAAGLPWWLALFLGAVGVAVLQWHSKLSKYAAWIIFANLLFILAYRYWHRPEPAGFVGSIPYALIVTLIGLALILTLGQITRVRRRHK